MIQIAIVDDHAIVRTGLRQFLGEQVDLRVVGEAANGREALELVRQTPVDVLLMDLSMPGQGGVEALQAIKARFPDLPVLILSGFPASRYAPTLMAQGASGYLNKECDPQEIVDAIRVVALGRRYLSAEVAELMAERALGGGTRLPHEALSERETLVFLRLAQGETVGAIAEALHLSVKTVSTYRSRVLTKLGLEGNSDLTYYAVRNGLID
ncbi:response regulator transcription factor [Hydrogenophaga sp. IBVHS2]|uniref:response regulator n=1 Tax=Hydrogenophaga sp. IBVHS2 TaxID=1985170 RepID=UPI000A2EBFB5|nr:response regulator transcription factor [Hydrogenophaga sp. IBVHS2]OSZ67284.1 DNA-binding response regulator [Hydrogenophaga sp. IBVHS2]